MDRRDFYLFKAAELLELAQNEHHAEFKAEFESLALAYLRLAEQAKQKDYLILLPRRRYSNTSSAKNSHDWLYQMEL